jgi:DNA-binding Xre family transcriptional regulator
MPALTPIQRLSRALRAVTSDGRISEVAAFARQWGLDGRAAHRAVKGKRISAEAYLSLCAALGIDPLTGAACEAKRITPIDWNRVGIKIKLAFIGTPDKPAPAGFTMRAAAAKWRVRLAPLGRMKGGCPASVDNFLALCLALECHPHDLLKLVPVAVNQKHIPEHVEIANGGAEA